MQFIASCPDIPDELLVAHEEGRVVFFCGAGISYPAGLPGFKELVDEIYRLLNTEKEGLEEIEYKKGNYDRVLDLLERRFPGQRAAVRQALTQILKPDLAPKGALDTHNALLKLGENRDGKLRLITTNFDRLFYIAGTDSGNKFKFHIAPNIIIPKKSRWNELVYLHGLLPEEDDDDAALNSLVLTSGDFGSAYLTEGWAARFASELFRNFVVCFVGYSIDDPVLRYIMDALAADRRAGETTPQAWAFGSYKSGKTPKKTNENRDKATKNWLAKGVNPILYADQRKHSFLHKTLKNWSVSYVAGINGKEAIVSRYAHLQPQSSTKQDDFVGRVLWALSDKTGLPAKRFAELDPTPPLEWLEFFCSERLGHFDLERFGVLPQGEIDTKLKFSLIQRPSPYRLAPRMSLFSNSMQDGAWDDIMLHLAKWLMKHLNDPRLIIWFFKNGGNIKDKLAMLINLELTRTSQIEKDGKLESLNAIPSPFMRKLWRYLVDGRIGTADSGNKLFYGWLTRLQNESLTTSVRHELREILTPKIELTEPVVWATSALEDNQNDKRKIGFKIVLNACDMPEKSIDFGEAWNQFLPFLLEDFQYSLCNALDIMKDLEPEDNLKDFSHFYLPFIEPNYQNQGLYEWVILIEFLRDSWLAIYAENKKRSSKIAALWFDLPYPTFKRLALFAASRDNCIASSQWVEWLLADNAWCLWKVHTHQEVYQLLSRQGKQLKKSDQERLEYAILAGPSEQYNLSEENRAYFIWFHLTNLKDSKLNLSKNAEEKILEINSTYKNFELKNNQNEGFSDSFGISNYIEEQDIKNAKAIPKTRDKLVQWLKNPAPDYPVYQNPWTNICQNQLSLSLGALCGLAKEGVWPKERWNQALQAWSDERMILRSWKYAAPLIKNMPEDVLLGLAHTLSRWLQVASKSIERHKDIFLEICESLLAVPSVKGITSDEPIEEAFNHPVGRITLALINFWLATKPSDNDLLPGDIKQLFTKICSCDEERFYYGRILLALYLVSLFRVDQDWTKQNLLPFFKWEDSDEAPAMWQGFLFSPRLYPPLFIAIKQDFLKSTKNYENLGKQKSILVDFLTYAASSQLDGYSKKDFRDAISALPSEGLEKCALSLAKALQSAAEQRESFWENCTKPFLHYIWPKTIQRKTNKISENFALLAVAAGDKFPEALSSIQYWLQPVGYPHLIISSLNESNLCARFPLKSLELLDKIINKGSTLPLQGFSECLKKIIAAETDLAQDKRYRRLDELRRQANL